MKCHWPKDCSNTVHTKGLCEQHYLKFYTMVGRPLTWKVLYELFWADPDNQTQFVCREQGCTAITHKAKGYCVHHYLASRYDAKPRAATPICLACRNELKTIWWQIDGKLYCSKDMNELFQNDPSIEMKRCTAESE